MFTRGIYFTDLNKLHIWLTYSNQTMHWIRNVIIPNDAKVYVEANKFKANKVILEDRQIIDWSDENVCKFAVQHNGIILRYAINQTYLDMYSDHYLSAEEDYSFEEDISGRIRLAIVSAKTGAD
jgi:hypothetical protein